MPCVMIMCPKREVVNLRENKKEKSGIVEFLKILEKGRKEGKKVCVAIWHNVNGLYIAVLAVKKRPCQQHKTKAFLTRFM